MNEPCELPDDFLDLVDAYCSGLIDDDGIHRLEAILLGSDPARRHFARYFHHHTEIQFAVRATHAADAALDRLAGLSVVPAGQARGRSVPGCRGPGPGG